MFLYADSGSPDRMHSLIWAFAVHIRPEDTFSHEETEFYF